MGLTTDSMLSKTIFHSLTHAAKLESLESASDSDVMFIKRQKRRDAPVRGRHESMAGVKPRPLRSVLC